MDNNVLLPQGRFIWGDIFNKKRDEYQGRPKLDKNNQEVWKYFVGYAVSKANPAWSQAEAKIKQIAASLFPAGESNRPDFAWKIKDGDDPKNAGKRGYAGCWVLALETKQEFQKVVWDQNTHLTSPLFENGIKLGDYIQSQISVSSNFGGEKPGIFLYVNFVAWISEGEAIITGPDVAAVLGAAAPAPGGPAAPAPGGPAAPAPAPAPDFLNPPQMTEAAGGLSYAQYQQAGWTDEQLIANGYMLPRQ